MTISTAHTKFSKSDLQQANEWWWSEPLSSLMYISSPCSEISSKSPKRDMRRKAHLIKFEACTIQQSAELAGF